MIVSTLLTAMAVGFLAAGDDDSRWVAFTSREGNFVIDLPGEPTKVFTRTARTKEGQVKIVVAECDTPDVLFIAQKIDLPKATGLKASETDAVLDYWRDNLANDFNGKVIAQKKLRLDGAAATGRDITIEGKPVDKKGIATVRMREYLGAKALYIVLAVTAPDRDLPEDVGHFFASFAIGTQRANKFGPRTEPVGKKIANWGEAIDPDKDCKITPKGKALEIQVPGTLHDLSAEIDTFNAPRVLKEVTGDFTMITKVTGDFEPGPKGTKPNAVPYNGAGIFVWQDSDNYIFLGRAAILRNNKVNAFAAFEEREWGSRAGFNNHALEMGDAYVKMERRGNRILGYTSKDGKTWTKLEPMETSYPATIKVGLYAISTSSSPFSVRFEDITYTTSKTAAKKKR